MARRLHRATRERLRAALGDAYLPFAEAVVAQVAHPLGAAPGDEAAVAERVIRLLDAAGAAAPEDEAALAAEPALLAALFQNVDVLPPRGDPRADAVSMLVLRAVHRLDAAG